MFTSDSWINFSLYFGNGGIFFMVLVSFWYWKNKNKSEEHNASFQAIAKLTCMLLLLSMSFVMSVSMSYPNIEVPLYLSLPPPFLLMAVACLIYKPYLGWLKWIFRRE